jgi:hypothetical protein
VNIEGSQMTILQAHLILVDDRVQLRESLSFLLTAAPYGVRFDPLKLIAPVTQQIQKHDPRPTQEPS